MTENNQVNHINQDNDKKAWVAPMLIEENISATKSGFATSIHIGEDPIYVS